MFRFSTDAVPPRDRFEFWIDAVSTGYTPLHMEPAGEHRFYGELAMDRVGDFEVVMASGAGHRTKRSRTEIAASREHFYTAALSLIDGVRFTSPDGEMLALKPGSVILIDTMHEFSFHIERPYRSLQVKFPAAWVEERFSRPDLLCGRMLSGQNPLARLFAGYLSTGFSIADELPPGAAAMFGRHLLEILGEAFSGPDRDAPGPSEAWRAAMFTRACRLIARDHADAGLGPEMIAARLGVSPRTLYRLFAENGDTVMRRIRAERVRQAANLLAAPAARFRRITEIAFSCGFSDAAHFTRVFTAETGVTPSTWRRLRL